MKRLLMMGIVMAASAGGAERLSDADVARVFVNLGRMNAIVFGLRYRLATLGTLEIGPTLHKRAVDLQLRDDELVDPWGTPYHIDIMGRDFRIIGAGADRKFNPEEWPVMGATSSLDADTVMGSSPPSRHNYSYAFGMLDKPEFPYGLYEPPEIVPLDRRDSTLLLANPHAAFRYDQMWETGNVALKHGETDQLRATRTLAAMRLLAARLQAWKASHGSLAALAGKDVVTVLRSEPWPFNDWLVVRDEWGTLFRLELDADGQSHRLSSAGSDLAFDNKPQAIHTDPAADQVIVDGFVAQQFDRVAWQKREMERVNAIDRATFAARSLAPVKAHDGSMAYQVGGEIVAPVKIRGSDPQLPPSLRSQGIGGILVLEILIDEQGHVVDVNSKMEANPELTAAVVETVKKWVYKPATLHGKTVRSILALTVIMRADKS